MRQFLSLLLMSPCILLLCAASCTTLTNQAEIGDDTGLTVEKVTAPGTAEISAEGPLDISDFVRNLTGGMEVVKVFPDPGIERWIELPGKTNSGRQYFDYRSPLYPKPISSADEMFAMLNHQAMIARQVNPGYTISLDVEVRNQGEREPLCEQKKVIFDVRRGVTIQDYRKEGTLKYTVRDVGGSLRYGQYIVVSAIVTVDEAEAASYNTLKAWMEQAETTDISGLLGELFNQSINRSLR
jgi:hypothetical protein